MAKENLILGIIGIGLSIWIFVKSKLIILPLLLIALGIGFIIFSKEEEKIEERKDIKVKQTKS